MAKVARDGQGWSMTAIGATATGRTFQHLLRPWRRTCDPGRLTGSMRHFEHIDAARRKHLFYRHPRPFGRHDDPAVLGVALGATLYCPATRPALDADIERALRRGVMSMVVCLEDAIGDDEVAAGEANLVARFRALHAREAQVPLLFVRVRDPGRSATWPTGSAAPPSW